mgnify:CR=1 FL=1
MIRKTIAVLICIFMIVLTFQGAVVAQEPNFKQKAAQLCRDGYLGDFNKDGKVRINDVRSALRVAIGLDVCTEEQQSNIDVDFSGGKTTINDVRVLLRYTVGLSGFEIPLTNEEIVNYFVEAANKVKVDNPGLDRTTTVVSPSIRVWVSNTEVQDMELSETKDYMDEQIAYLEKYRDLWGLILSEEKIKELEDSIEQWNLNKENIDKAYEPKVETFHVQAGKSHYAAFTVRGKTWSSRATADDVKSAKLIYNRGSYEIMINYDEYFYSELPLDMTTLEYGRMFDLPSCTALTKPSDTSFVFNALTLKNGLVRSKIDLDTGTLEDAKYFFEYIWDYSQIGKDSTTNEDTESRFVYTVKNTAEYVMGEGLPQ